MMTRILLVLVILLAAAGAGIYLSYNTPAGLADLGPSLFDNKTADWALVGIAAAGFVGGAARGLLKKKSAIKDGVVIRHGVGSLIEHWGTGLGIFMAIASGIILGVSLGFWTIGPFARTPKDIVSPINFHFVSVVFILFCSFFFVGDYVFGRDFKKLIPNGEDVTKGFIGKYMLRRPWTKEEKYLSSQKSAFVPYILIGLVILITGAVKVASHVWPIKADLAGWATILHDYFAVFIILFTIVHMGIIVMLGHWPAFWSWFTGTLKTHEVEHEHPVWYEELKTGRNKS